MFCSQCAAPLPSAARFCTNCAAPVPPTLPAMPVASAQPIPTRSAPLADRANDLAPDTTSTTQRPVSVVIPVLLVGVVYVTSALLLGWWAWQSRGYGGQQGAIPSLVLAAIVVVLAAALGRWALGVVAPSSLARGCLAVAVIPVIWALNAVNTRTDSANRSLSIGSAALVVALLVVLISTSRSSPVVKAWTSVTVIACAVASSLTAYLHWRDVIPFGGGTHWGGAPGGLGPFSPTSVALVLPSAIAACATLAAVWSGSERRLRPAVAVDPSWGTTPGAFAPAGVSYGPTNSMAIAALVLGLSACLSPLGLIFGLVALSQIKASGGRQQGRGMAIAGVVLGSLGVLLWVLYVVLVVALGTVGSSTSG